MDGLSFVQAYINDLLIIMQGPFKQQLDHLEQVLSHLKIVGFKVCTAKSKLACHELEYLGCFITCDGIKPLNKKLRQLTMSRIVKIYWVG